MGCDIHGFIEVLEYHGWETIISLDLFLNRNYKMFGILADVRNNLGFTPIAPGRGLPYDASYWTRAKYEKWEADAHSATWMTLQEMLKYDWNEKLTFENPAETITPKDVLKEDPRFELMIEIMKLLARKYRGVRIVIWFDN